MLTGLPSSYVAYFIEAGPGAVSSLILPSNHKMATSLSHALHLIGALAN